MKKLMLATARTQLITMMVAFSPAVAAQATGSVVESQPFTPGRGNTSNTSTAAASNNDGLALLLEQNQQLRAEVSALRGLVEEQGFELRKMQRDSLSRYTNLDDRLIQLESAPNPSIGRTTPSSVNPSTTAINTSAGLTNAEPTSTRRGIQSSADLNSSATIANSSSASAPPTRNVGRGLNRGTLQPAVLSEQQLYQMAYDSVINSNFERSIAEFDQYLSVYPSGRFITNAYYWKGQAYLYLSRFEEARDSYERILNDYADSPKLPDAMYGLGLAYQGLGNIPQARQLLNDIKRRYPNTGVANLADTRLLSLD